MYKRLRRTDFLPVGPEQEHEVLERGYDSLSSDDEAGCGLEYAFSSGDDDWSDVSDPEANPGNTLVDF